MEPPAPAQASLKHPHGFAGICDHSPLVVVALGRSYLEQTRPAAKPLLRTAASWFLRWLLRWLLAALALVVQCWDVSRRSAQPRCRGSDASIPSMAQAYSSTEASPETRPMLSRASIVVVGEVLRLELIALA